MNEGYVTSPNEEAEYMLQFIQASASTKPDH